MTYPFIENSDYGQAVLELAGAVASLMDDEKQYKKVEINRVLIEIKTMAFNIQKNMSGRDKDSYFMGVSE